MLRQVFTLSAGTHCTDCRWEAWRSWRRRHGWRHPRRWSCVRTRDRQRRAAITLWRCCWPVARGSSHAAPTPSHLSAPGGRWVDWQTAGCDALSVSQIGADVSEESIASASACRGLPYITYFSHVACSSTLNTETPSSNGTFVSSHQTGELRFAEDRRHVKHEVAQAIFQDGHVRRLNIGPFK